VKLLVATDAWHPQVNGVVRTLGHMAREAAALGVHIEFLGPDSFYSVPMPSYPEIRLSLVRPGAVGRHLARAAPDAIHIATEGPIGQGMRTACAHAGRTFTTSFHTRFPDYLAGRMPIASGLGARVAWRWLRNFHGDSAAVMAPTPSLVSELMGRGFRNVRLWPRGVDTELFRPRANIALDLPRPIFLTVGRLAVEKNVEAFLSLDLPGTKLVVGDGPARASLERRFPDAVFLGARQSEALAEIYAGADVFVFPSLTDTYGLVLLEALASGVPVAAFPAPAPRDVIGDAGVGVLDQDLRRACLAALAVPRADCREFACRLTWRASAQAFLGHVADAHRGTNLAA
jgi:glycosyltransferase involved in cell wall biosynthesis